MQQLEILGIIEKKISVTGFEPLPQPVETRNRHCPNSGVFSTGALAPTILGQSITVTAL